MPKYTLPAWVSFDNGTSYVGIEKVISNPDLRETYLKMLINERREVNKNIVDFRAAVASKT